MKMKSRWITGNFVRFLMGRTLSVLGGNMLRFALSLYILEQTGSAAEYGTVLALGYVPTILLSPLGGVLADRADRRAMMAALNAGYCALALGMAVCCAAGGPLRLLEGLLLASSVLRCLDAPVVQASVPLLSNGNIARANAATNQTVQLVGVLSPMLGSALYGALGGARLGVLLALCAALHALASGVALTLRIPRTRAEKRESAGAAVWKDIGEILRFAFVQRKELGRVMLFNALLTLLLNPFLAMGVTYTVSVRLVLPAVWNGTAQSVIGASTLLGCWLAGRAVGRFRVRQLYLLIIAAGAGLLPAALALVEGMPVAAAYVLTVLSGAVIVVLCYFAGVYITSGLQGACPGGMMGRMMALFTATNNLTNPVGTMLQGVIYDKLSGALPAVFAVMAAMVMLAAACSREIYAALDEKSVLTGAKAK